MKNLPEIKLGVIAVSRDCFPAELSKKRLKKVVEECAKIKLPVIEFSTVVENEKDSLAALDEIKQKKVNALAIYLGNFGPEGPTTILAERFGGPVMLCGAAEESGKDLVGGRGDAFCGMLNASYNTGLRGLRPYIPEYPIATAEGIAQMMKDFVPIASTVAGVHGLKIMTFGPRPQDFLACNAPIKPLYDLGVEIMENSELDLYDIFLASEGKKEIDDIAKEMAQELGGGNTYPDLLKRIARLEHSLVTFHNENKGASSYAVFANKCWPSFEKYFGCTPCYVNSRLASRGIPVSCEVDIYGTLSEYIAACATGLPPTILDINNTVPADMIEKADIKSKGYVPTDLFMGFHCGNTPSCHIMGPAIRYQLIMHRLMEPGKEPDITRGTLEGRIKPGDVTVFRLQSTADARLTSYMAQGEVMDIDPCSFGGIGVFAVREMSRFYRHVLIEKRFPHHTAVAFAHAGKTLFEAMKMLGVADINYNRPAGLPYPTENPYA